MRCFAFVSVLLHQSLGFSPVAPLHVHVSTQSSSSALQAITQDDDNVGKTLQRNVAGIAATVALGWAMGASSSIAAPTSNEWMTQTSTTSSSSFVVAYSDSDFADFSLPSYAAVRDAEINSNLKGDNTMMEQKASVSAASSSTADEASSAPAKKEPTAAEIKAQKAAAKAEMQAARARQQAAVEAAMAAK